jgi:peptidoglycan/LPS O-acetylase OafA/YrhL
MATPVVGDPAVNQVSEPAPNVAQASGQTERIPALDGVRGLAALSILIYHFMPTAQGDGLAARLGRLTEIGWAGVDLFFVLSGFLITGILLDAKGSPHYFRNFYARRVLRIFPLYYGTLFALFVLLPLVIFFGGLGSFLGERLGVYYDEYRELQRGQLCFWLYLSNVPGFVDPTHWHYFLSHFWSLAVEEHFYLVWPALVYLLSRRQILAMCVCLIAASLTLRFVGYAFGQRFFCYIFTPCRLDGLAMGSLLAVLARGPGGIARLVRPFATAGLAALAFLIVGFSRQDSLHFGSEFASTIGFSLLAILFAAFLVLVVAAPNDSWLGRLMGGSFLGFFGKYSYGLYVFNRFLMLPAKRLFPAERLAGWLGSPLLGALAHVVLATAMTAVVAYMSWHLFEKHFLKLKRFFRDRKPGQG